MTQRRCLQKMLKESMNDEDDYSITTNLYDHLHCHSKHRFGAGKVGQRSNTLLLLQWMRCPNKIRLIETGVFAPGRHSQRGPLNTLYV